MEYEDPSQIKESGSTSKFLSPPIERAFTVFQHPQVVEVISTLIDTPNDDLPEVLAQIDIWKWPRSDLNAWIKILNKFDAILEEIIRDYNVDKLQVNPFSPVTKKTLCEILRFERLLLENSTNRKTFNSYDVRIHHINLHVPCLTPVLTLILEDQ